MATYDKTGGAATGIPLGAAGRVYVAKQTVDLTGEAMTDNDIYQVIAVPANSLVRSVSLEIEKAAVGSTCTIDVGITGDNSLLDGVNGKTEAISHSSVGVAEASVQGVLYTAADTIDVTMEAITAITAGPKFTLRAEIVDFN